MESIVNTEKIRNIISERGCSMMWISNKTGIPYRRVVDLINGRLKWTLGDVRAFIDAFNLSAKDRKEIFLI